MAARRSSGSTSRFNVTSIERNVDLPLGNQNRLADEAGGSITRSDSSRVAGVSGSSIVRVRRKERVPLPFSAKPEEDATTWLDKYTQTAKYNGWDEEERLWNFGECLMGSASVWFECVKSKKLDWPSVTKAFLDAFRPQDYEAILLTELQNRRQRENETPLSYFHDVIRLCHKLDKEMSDKTKLIYLSRGLDSELFQCLHQSIVAHGNSTEAFFKVLKTHEQTMRLTRASEPDLMKPSTALQVHSTTTVPEHLNEESFSRKRSVDGSNEMVPRKMVKEMIEEAF